MNAGSRNIYNSKRPVRSIDDLKGLKIRMMGNPIFVDTMNALGGNGVSMGFDHSSTRCRLVWWTAPRTTRRPT
jgi:TRAP-type C4-dicarboxylate transport system substrate-binding protein